MMTVEKFKEVFESDIVMIDPGFVDTDTVLQELSDWDSLAYISLNACLDENYGFTLTANELAELSVFGDIVKHINKHL
ncbi:acyl carrier protein [Cohnella panacarvi]|uniref:acyl carrier protein n=1 Tax=Cohnella panacarvi TaxID=400776 RepID=UPI0004794EB3|nr:acyl carrier protein [Cohnella panacarvi]